MLFARVGFFLQGWLLLSWLFAGLAFAKLPVIAGLALGWAFNWVGFLPGWLWFWADLELLLAELAFCWVSFLLGWLFVELAFCQA